MRPFKIIFLIAAFSLMTGGSAYSYNWIINPANNHKYALTERADIFANCEAEAVRAGGHLVTINNEAENTWVRNNLGTGDYWIGFATRYIVYELWNYWYWQDGSGYWQGGPSGGIGWTYGFYTHWAYGDPNYRDGFHIEDCAVMKGSGYWDDIMGTDSRYGVIEVPLSHVVPLPGAVWLLGSGLMGLVGWRRLRKL
jgi:hypothetical protein